MHKSWNTKKQYHQIGEKSIVRQKSWEAWVVNVQYMEILGNKEERRQNKRHPKRPLSQITLL